MNDILQQLQQQFAGFGPNLLAGLAVLVLGWLVAVFASFVVRQLLKKTSVDNRMAVWMSGPETKTAVPVEEWVGKGVFYLIMLIVLVAFFSTVRLGVITQSLNALVQPFLNYLPRLAAAGLLALVAWVLATALKRILEGVLKAAKLDQRLGGATGTGGSVIPLSSTFAEVVYWIVFLVFLPPILQALGMDTLLVPVTTLFNKAFAFLPNLLSAAAIGVIGWFVARIVQRIVQSLLASAGVDRLGEKWGLIGPPAGQKISGILGTVIYFVILIPVVISALGALQLETITKPASDMLAKILDALPNLIGAAVILLLAVLIGRIVSGLVSNVLCSLGFNSLPVRLGLARELPAKGRQTPAGYVGMLVMLSIVLLASVTAADMLGFRTVGALITDFVSLAGRILMGIVIFGLGLLLAQIVASGIATSGVSQGQRLAQLVRIIILALAGAMALRQTGLANEIVNLAFGLTLGAVAVAFALAFGLGGREVAQRALQEWRDSNHTKKQIS